MVKQKDTTLAVVTHLLPLIISFVGPLIIYLVTEDEFVKKNAAKALNWQISLLIYFAISVILMIIFIGFILLLVLIILSTVFPIIAAVKANEGKIWDYPVSINFIKT